MLQRGALIARLIVALPVLERDATRDPIRAVPGDLDRGWVFLVALIAGFPAVDRVAERAGGAGSHGANDLLHPCTIGIDEGVLAEEEHRGQPVRAEASMGAEAAVVEHSHLLTNVGITAVRDPLWILLAGEADAGMGAIAERLIGRAATAAQRHLRPRRDALAQPGQQGVGIGHQVGATQRGLDGTTQLGLHLFQLGDFGCDATRTIRRRKLAGQVLQRGRGFLDLSRKARVQAELRRKFRQLPESLTEEHPGRRLVRQQVNVTVVAKARARGLARPPGTIYRQLRERLA